MDDRYVRASKQDMHFYAQFWPIQGDRLARLRGASETEQAAREAEAVSYHTVLSTNERRTGSGQIAYVEIEVEHWEYDDAEAVAALVEGGSRTSRVRSSPTLSRLVRGVDPLWWTFLHFTH